MSTIAAWPAIAVLALMGALGVYRPEAILAPFGVRTLTRDARNEVRAVYGGFGLAVATLLIATLDDPAGIGVRLGVAVALCGMAGGRVLSALIDRGLGLYPGVFLALELLLAGALLA